MRILIIHNLYQQPGGEDVVFQQEAKAIREFADVRTLSFKNKRSTLGLLQSTTLPWNFISWKKIKRQISAYNPDIIHFHNTHYAIGPWPIREIRKLGIPVVMTLHNYRLLCPSATLYFKGQIYLNSMNAEFPWHAVWNGVQDRSRLKTALYAFTNYFHRKIKTWQMVDRYLVLTESAKQLFVKSSFPVDSDKFVVKPNYVEDDENDLARKPQSKREEHFLFVGRISEEKGIKTVIEAFQNNHFKLKIAGDGPLRQWMESEVTGNERIQYLGALPREDVQKEMLNCKALIFPSEWFEGMPMTIIEAFKNRTPVIATNLGAMASMIQHEVNGFLFLQKDATDLNKQLSSKFVWQTNLHTELSENAHASFQNHYCKEVSINRLKAVYGELLKDSHKIDRNL